MVITFVVRVVDQVPRAWLPLKTPILPDYRWMNLTISSFNAHIKLFPW